MEGIPNRGLRLLCFDAGGFQSKASLMILESIMMMLNTSENVGEDAKPCTYFDIIAGTSFGGVNAIMLGRLEYSVEHAIQKYDEFGQKAFGRKGSVESWAATGYPIVDEKPLEDVFKDMGRAGTDFHQHMVDPKRKGRCKCVVTTIPANSPSSRPILIRSYPCNAKSPPYGHQWTVWEALRATSATPVYLRPLALQGFEFSDASTAGYANPSLVLLDEIKKLAEYKGRSFECLVSIGTGLKSLFVHMPPVIPRFFFANIFTKKRHKEILRYFTLIATNTKPTADEVYRRFSDSGHLTTYFRFDPPQDLSQINPLDVTSMADIEAIVHDYVDGADVRDRLVQCASKLQGHRHRHSTHVGPSSRLPRMEPDQLQHPFRLPLTLDLRGNPNFMGRAKELRRLAEVLHNDGKIFVLHGIGGMGKTQTALEFAFRFQSNFSSIFWVNAVSRVTATASFIQIAQRLVIHYGDEQHSEATDYYQVAQLLGLSGLVSATGQVTNNETSALRVINAVKSWLAFQSNDQWLLIFDNYNDLKFDMLDFFPTRQCGNLIITSQRPGSTRLGTHFEEIEGLDAENAVSLLFKLSNKTVRESDMEDAQEIVRSLEYLPLAIDQAGAYIAARQLLFSEYLPRYRRNFNSLMAEKPEGYSYYAQTALTTWNMSFEAIQTEKPGAAKLLRLCSFLDKDDILDVLIHHGRKLPEGDNTTENELITIFSYSLAKRNDIPGSFRIHSVVHRWAREQLDSTKQCEAVLTAVDLLADFCTFGSIKRTAELLGLALRVVPHIDACVEALKEIFQDDLWHTVSPKTLVALADAYRFLCRYRDAEEILKHVLEEQKKVLSLQDINVLLCMNHLARVYKLQGRHDQAAKLFEETWAERVKVLGFYDFDTLATANNLGLVYKALRRFPEAKKLLQQTLLGREEVLGGDNPDTLVTANNLAFVYQAMGNTSEAEVLYNRALEGLQRCFGEEHPETLITKHNLASLRFQCGQQKEAIEIYQSVLTGRERSVGPSHHDTLVTVRELAMAHRSQHNYKEAAKLLRRALTGFEDILGNDHGETLAVAEDLTLVLNEQAGA